MDRRSLQGARGRASQPADALREARAALEAASGETQDVRVGFLAACAVHGGNTAQQAKITNASAAVLSALAPLTIAVLN
jgi:hypothetical protein